MKELLDACAEGASQEYRADQADTQETQGRRAVRPSLSRELQATV